MHFLFVMQGKFNESDIKIDEDEIDNYGFFTLDNIPDNTFEYCRQMYIDLKEYSGKVLLR